MSANPNDYTISFRGYAEAIHRHELASLEMGAAKIQLQHAEENLDRTISQIKNTVAARVTHQARRT